jgi:hypothetical protein
MVIPPAPEGLDFFDTFRRDMDFGADFEFPAMFGADFGAAFSFENAFDDDGSRGSFGLFAYDNISIDFSIEGHVQHR